MGTSFLLTVPVVAHKSFWVLETVLAGVVACLPREGFGPNGTSEYEEDWRWSAAAWGYDLRLSGCKFLGRPISSL